MRVTSGTGREREVKRGRERGISGKEGNWWRQGERKIKRGREITEMVGNGRG